MDCVHPAYPNILFKLIQTKMQCFPPLVESDPNPPKPFEKRLFIFLPLYQQDNPCFCKSAPRVFTKNSLKIWWVHLSRFALFHWFLLYR